jgi:hypothetical protein
VPQTPPSAHELYEPSGMPPGGYHTYLTDESRAYDLAGPGPWTFTSRGQDPAVVTTHEGPVTDMVIYLIRRTYPDVEQWAVRPQRIDETYRDTGTASRRLSVLLRVEKHTARAILTIAADPALDMRYVHGPWEITGDDDEQTWRIRNINPDPDTFLVPVTRRQAERVVPVLRDWANAGDITVACLRVADAIDQAVSS